MKSTLEKTLTSIEPYSLDDYTIVVFGAGNTSLLYQKCFERECIKPVYYVDNNKAKKILFFTVWCYFHLKMEPGNKIMIKKNIVKEISFEMKNQFVNSKEYFAKTRDVFTARIQSFVLETKKYLEAAVIGEIGNNTFDHNFVFSNDYPRGVYCNTEYNEYTVVADFGKGLRQSLAPVVLSISSDLDAIETAFTKKISGRFPEQRGNGLKFVSETIQQNDWHLYFQSGTGCCSIDKNGVIFFQEDTSLIGCMAIIKF